MPDIVKYVTVIPPKVAVGVVGQVYDQSRREVGRLVEAVTMFSGDPALLAAGWAAFREPLLAAGHAPRVAKEAVAATVARLNECPFCVDAHAIMLYGGGAGDFAAQLLDGTDLDAIRSGYQALARWVGDASTADTVSAHPPYTPEQEPEFLGVLVYFHFLTRAINVLLEGTFLPGSERARRVARRLAGKALARRVAAVAEPGGAVGLTPLARPLPADLAWAAPSATIAAAVAGLDTAVTRAGERALSEAARAVVERTVGQWRGETPGPGASWADEPLDGLAPHDRAAARLALLCALTPYQVTSKDVTAYRLTHPGDTDLLGAVAWGAFTAARRIGAWTAAARGGVVR